MTFASVARKGTTYTDGGTASTVKVIDLPDNLIAGDRVIIALSTGSTTAFTWPASPAWSTLAAINAPTSGGRLEVRYRDIDGTEGWNNSSSTISVTTGNSKGTAFPWCITGHDPGTAPVAATATGSATATPDPASLDPATWATEDTLWIVVCYANANCTTVSYPLLYTDNNENVVSTGASATSSRISSRNLNASSDDPGVLTISAAQNCALATIAVRPTSGLNIPITQITSIPTVNPITPSKSLPISQITSISTVNPITPAGQAPAEVPHMDTNMESLQRYAQRNFGLDLNGALRIATGINKEPNGISQQLYGRDINGTDPTGSISIFDRFKTLLGGRYLNLPGGAGNYISTPDVAALDLAADMTMEIGYRCAAYNFVHSLVSKFNSTGNQRAYRFRVTGAGLPEFTYSTAGTAGVSRLANGGAFSTEAPFTEVHLIFEFDAVDGANHTVRFFRSDRKAGPFIQVGTDVTNAGNIAVFNSTSVLEIGSVNAGAAEIMQGQVLYVNLYNGIGGGKTLVASPDFRFRPPGSTAFADSTGKTWTFQGTAAVV